jgi:Ca2+-binding RTX toxin-like protein
MAYTYNGTNGNDEFNYLGFDTLLAFGYGGDDTIWGNTKDDVISGGDGNDYLLGWKGNDWLVGDKGNDRLDGYFTESNQFDTLTGGTGSDTFVLGDNSGVSYRGNGHAIITDWNAADDWIEVTGNRNRYSLRRGNWEGSSARDTGIFFKNDLIAVIQDSTNVNIARDFRLN